MILPPAKSLSWINTPHLNKYYLNCSAMIHLQLRSFCNSLLHFLYPSLCEGCRKALLPGEEVLCISCCMALPQTKYHHIELNETALRFAGRFPFIQATSFAYFIRDGVLQHLLHQLKYEGRKKNGLFLGHQLGASLRQTAWATGISCILPVPLHASKNRLRGFNQSDVIAKGLSQSLALEVETDILVRIRNTDSQTRKNRAERADNVADAFSVHRPEKIRDRHVLLLDDVLTTGATLEACSKAVLAVPGTSVSIATIGIAIS
jgi:ComF family protein